MSQIFAGSLKYMTLTRQLQEKKGKQKEWAWKQQQKNIFKNYILSIYEMEWIWTVDQYIQGTLVHQINASTWSGSENGAHIKLVCS